MPHYLIQAAYTTEALQSLIKAPQNRTEVVGAAIEHLGGKLVGNWAAFGDYDTIVIVEMPTNVDAAAMAIAVAAGGSCKAVKTTALLSTEETLEAVKRAGSSGYKPVASAAAASR
ncbi:MAG: GYD domain-containing protein [Candidatus Acidiferrales bacterium]